MGDAEVDVVRFFVTVVAGADADVIDEAGDSIQGVSIDTPGAASGAPTITSLLASGLAFREPRATHA